MPDPTVDPCPHPRHRCVRKTHIRVPSVEGSLGFPADVRIGGPDSPGPKGPRGQRRGGHGEDPPPCALCDGYGDVVNPGNADPERKVTDWLPPVGCPRCGQTGKDPNP